MQYDARCRNNIYYTEYNIIACSVYLQLTKAEKLELNRQLTILFRLGEYIRGPVWLILNFTRKYYIIIRS
jgi:hypothetical protein